jgi:hypothetical protein
VEIPKIDSDLVPYLILLGTIMAATGAGQMWVLTALILPS